MSFQLEIENLIESIDKDFLPQLSSIISIPEYVEKIVKRSAIFSIHRDGVLVAFASVYCNDFVNFTAYMSMLAVSKEYRNNGLALNILKNCIDFLKNNNFHVLRLEVYKTNFKAINFYKKIGFFQIRETDASVFMELNID